MRISVSSVIAISVLCLTLPAAASAFGIMQSAETIDKGVYKFTISPLMHFGSDGADDEFGVAARAGYGFSDKFDAEAKLGFFENVTLVGLDGEYWLVKDKQVDVSLGAGLHFGFAGDDGFDSMGIELTPLASGHISENLELYGALAVSLEKLSDVPEPLDDSYTSIQLVPGLEYKVSENIDLVGEFGLGLNDDSSDYAGVGIAFYLR